MTACLTNQQLLTAIKTLPDFSEVTATDISRLSGGLCNVNVKVKQANRIVVIRFLTATDASNSVDRQREFDHQLLAAKANIAPQPHKLYDISWLQCHFGEAWHPLAKQFCGVMVVDYCAGYALLSANQSTLAQLQSLGTSLAISLATLVAAVHQLPYQALDQGACLNSSICDEYQSPYKRLNDYWQLVSQGNDSGNEELGLQHQLVMTELLKQLKELTPGNLCLIHGDLNGGNIIVGSNQLWLIDWEFSALDDPYIDLASVLVEFNLTPSQRQLFLNQYETAATSIDLARLALLESYYCALCWLWFKLQPSELAEHGDGERYYNHLHAHFALAKG